jgi:hypothetical protein
LATIPDEDTSEVFWRESHMFFMSSSL